MGNVRQVSTSHAPEGPAGSPWNEARLAARTCWRGSTRLLRCAYRRNTPSTDGFSVADCERMLQRRELDFSGGNLGLQLIEFGTGCGLPQRQGT